MVITGLAVGIAACSAKTAVDTLKNQRITNELALALSLFDKINSYWDMVISNPANSKYYLGQILVYFETAAGLFNRHVFSGTASDILSDHIIEVWSKMRLSETGPEFINQLSSSATTFEELGKFFENSKSKALADITHREGAWDNATDQNDKST